MCMSERRGMRFFALRAQNDKFGVQRVKRGRGAGFFDLRARNDNGEDEGERK